MMKRRLTIAKRLLKPDGVLICHHRRKRGGHLSVLLEMLFPSICGTWFSVVINPKGTGKLNFARVDEYAFFCVPNDGTSVIRGVPTGKCQATLPGEGALFYPNTPAAPLFPDNRGDEDRRCETTPTISKIRGERGRSGRRY